MIPNPTHSVLDGSRHGRLFGCVVSIITFAMIHDSRPLPAMEGSAWIVIIIIKSMYFSENEIRRINEAASGRLLDVVKKFHTLTKKGMGYVCDCPKCSASKKFGINPDKEIFKCFGCNEMAGKGAISYLMIVEGYSYAEALELLKKELVQI